MTISSDELQAKLERLHRMSAQDLAQFEKVIAKDFRDLASQYVRARLIRGLAIYSQLESQLSFTANKEASWNRIVGFELETIASLTSTAEDLITRRPGALSSLREYDDELSAVCRSLEGPLDFDPSVADPVTNHVPFSHKLKEVLAPHVVRLRLIACERKYQARLTNHLAQANAEISWNQYYTDVVERKNSLIEETERQLIDLDKEYACHRHRQQRHWFKPLARTRRAIASRRIQRKEDDNTLLQQSFRLSPSDVEDDLQLIKARVKLEEKDNEPIAAGSDLDEKPIAANIDLDGSHLQILLDHSMSLHDGASSREDSALEIDALDMHLLDTDNDDSLLDDMDPDGASRSQPSPRTRYKQLIYSQDNIGGQHSGFQLPLFPPLAE